MKTGNIFEPVKGSGQDELIMALLERTGFKLEQIVSNGRGSDPDSGMTRRVMNGCCSCAVRPCLSLSMKAST